MIPIEELKHWIFAVFKPNHWFWWYLLRNWNSIADQHKPGRKRFDDTYWGIETLISREVIMEKPTGFDDTYWGIETTFRSAFQCRALVLMIPIEELKLITTAQAANLLVGVLMIPIEELKLISSNDCKLFFSVLMIPIEELKLQSLIIGYKFVFAFWWYLLRNWNRNFRCDSSRLVCLFWWYLLRNWNLKKSASMYDPSVRFWWYLLRNWNLWSLHFQHSGEFVLMIPIEELKPGCIRARGSLTWVLMIPIEELKHRRNICRRSVCAGFDDTYWGIETSFQPWKVEMQSAFWWYLLRNWNPR